MQKHPELLTIAQRLRIHENDTCILSVIMRPGPAVDQLCVFHVSLCLFGGEGAGSSRQGFHSVEQAGIELHYAFLIFPFIKCKMELKIETLAQKYHYHQGLVVWPVISTTYQVDTERLQSQDLPRLHTKFQANMVRLCLKEKKKKKKKGECGSVTEYLPSMCVTLGSIITNNEKSKTKNQSQSWG